jgi:hypothetical protein
MLLQTFQKPRISYEYLDNLINRLIYVRLYIFFAQLSREAFVAIVKSVHLSDLPHVKTKKLKDFDEISYVH